MADYQAIVVGSGAGGLSAALGLCRRGISVLLLEAMPSFGGYLNPFRRRSYMFDPGLHYLGELGEGARFRGLLDELGIGDRVSFVELAPDRFDRYVFPDYEFQLCKGKERFKERLLRDFPKEERGINRFFQVLDKIVEATDASVKMGKGIFSMLGFLLRHPVMMKYSRVPYQRLLDEVTSDRRLQAVLSAHWATYALPPARASIVIALFVWNHFLQGAYYPLGGGASFRDAFLNALREGGVEMKNRCRVVRIEKRAKEFRIETGSGEEYTTRVVISDVDPVITLGELTDPGTVPSKIMKKVKRLRPSLGALQAFVGTDLDLPSMGITDANIHHSDHFDINRIYDMADASAFHESVPFYFLTSPSVKDPEGGHAPQGRHTVQIATFVKYESFEKWAGLVPMKRGEEYKAFKERLGEGFVKAAERYIPGLSGHMECVEYATPLTSEYWVNAVRGGCYGPEQSPDQVGPGRFSSLTSGIEGLFLAGAGTIGGGIMPCVWSGVLAAQKAAKHLGVPTAKA
ncbi:MAG: NAD(P)/FAD-dependent oxidoreductase [Deltaproteobacteria bacterium]|nr:NAD(P)/FAD-dependent oxidoreductase [Deltaproteobacteria bacterium]